MAPMSRREPAPAGAPAWRRMWQAWTPAMDPPLRVPGRAVGLLLAVACGAGEPEGGGAPFTPKATVEVATLQPEELRNVGRWRALRLALL